MVISLAYFLFMAEKCPDRLAPMAKAMGENVGNLPEVEKAFA